MLLIRGWGRFEKGDCRKIKGPIPWVGRLTDLAGPDMMAIAAEPDYLAILGAFDLLVRFAAGRPADERPKSIDLEPRALALALRCDEAALVRAVAVLAGPNVAWVTCDWPAVSESQCTGKSGASSADLRRIFGGSSADLRHVENPTLIQRGRVRRTRARLNSESEKTEDLRKEKNRSSKTRNDPVTPAAETQPTPDRVADVHEKTAPESEPAAAPSKATQESLFAGCVEPKTKKPAALPELAAWDAAYLETIAREYPRTNWRKESALVRVIPEADRTDTPRLLRAMHAALSDPWFRDKADFSLFVATYARWAAKAGTHHGTGPKSAGGALGVLARDAAAHQPQPQPERLAHGNP